MRRCYPKGTPPAAIPPDAEGITLEQWRAQQPLASLVDEVLRRDLAKKLAAEEAKRTAKRGKK